MVDRTSAAKDPNALVGTILAERYRIEELLGQGGMGTVYRAEHVHMRRTVAFKVKVPRRIADPCFRSVLLGQFRPCRPAIDAIRRARIP